MRLTRNQTLILLGLAGAGAAALAVRRTCPRPPIAPVPHLDLERYLGDWYEIARFPNRFEKECAGAVTAHYEKRADGSLRVLNRCRDEAGRIDEAEGRARLAGPAGSATLKVRFAPAWLSFLPAVWGDYWVVDLDADYTLAAVSEPRGDYLWILSRTPHVDSARLDALIGRLQRQGLDVSKLRMTPQDG